MTIFGAPFHASYGQASVDPLSNFVELPEFNFEKDIDALCRRKLEPDRIPLFLHEATHHWCFDTPVFYALYILQFRALGGLCKIANKQEVDEWDVIDDIYRSRAVVDFYRPIIEGLALFAEYVAVPRGEYTYSHPFTQVNVLCGGWLEKVHEKERPRAVLNLLTGARTSGSFVRKKAGLLAMPFDPARSPYLTGHVLVCSMWRALLMRGVSMLTNTDAFLSYLRSYFFFDYDLIAILINNELHENAIVQSIGQHLMRRIIRLISPDLSILLALRNPKDEKDTAEDVFRRYSNKALNAAVADWDTNDCVALEPSHIGLRRRSTWFHKAKVLGLDTVFSPIRGVLIDEAKVAQTQKQLLAAFDWLLAEKDELESLAIVKETAFRILMHRPNLTLCRCPVRAIVENGRCVAALETGKLNMRAATGTQSGEHKGRLELVVSSRIVHPLAYVYADGKLIGMAVPPQLTDPNQGDILGGVEFQQFVQIFKKVIAEDVSVLDSYVQILTGSYEQRIFEAVDHVYDTVFMALFPSSDWLNARPKMQEDGLRGFESASFAGVRGLASLSQLSCFPISDTGWKALASEIREDGGSPDPVDEAMRFFGPDSRMPLMEQKDAHWLIWI